ncbi:hypothetical protein NLJ89_g7706 [Agrocybe chaxingu]|uniref:Uncharacterized protein n=1 Tax=Agrocybe chaxingu TaxID=84603 RepID=A0A9W8K349_9AGAR|nr:hypothetical protein NLJ89_g7706 [Agrocybe chaxingu]
MADIADCELLLHRFQSCTQSLIKEFPDDLPIETHLEYNMRKGFAYRDRCEPLRKEFILCLGVWAKEVQADLERDMRLWRAMEEKPLIEQADTPKDSGSK